MMAVASTKDSHQLQALAGPAYMPPPPAMLMIKGKGKGKERRPMLPLALRVPGADAADESGCPICFGYNLGECTAAPPGGRCPKGRHICILRNCKGAAHSWQTNH